MNKKGVVDMMNTNNSNHQNSTYDFDYYLKQRNENMNMIFGTSSNNKKSNNSTVYTSTKSKNTVSNEEKMRREKEKEEAKRLFEQERQRILEERQQKIQQEVERKLQEKQAKERQKELAEQERQRVRNELKRSQELEELKRQRDKLEAEQRKQEARELAEQEKRIHKIEKAKESQYKKKKNKYRLTIFRNALVALACIVGGGFALKQLGVFDEIKSSINESIADSEQERYIEEIKEKSKLSFDENNNPTYYPSPSETPTLEPTPTPIPEKHEVIDTSYYNNSDYEFDYEITASFLKKLNPKASDNTAWIIIPGTEVNYPVVLPSMNKIDELGLRDEIEKSGMRDYVYMNQYYMKKDLLEKYKYSGTIYIDASNKGLNQHFSDINDHTVIYGHNMKNGSMFHTIEKYKKDKYLTEHPYAIIYTDDGYGYMLEFVATRIIDGDDSGALHTDDFKDIEDKKAYVQEIMNQATKKKLAVNENYVPQDDDKYISLITCNHDGEDERIQLIGKISGKIKVRDSSLTNDENGYYVEETTSTLHR